MIRRPPRSTRTDTLFPYTTLFRSAASRDAAIGILADIGRAVGREEIGLAVHIDVGIGLQIHVGHIVADDAVRDAVVRPRVCRIGLVADIRVLVVAMVELDRIILLPGDADYDKSEERRVGTTRISKSKTC